MSTSCPNCGATFTPEEYNAPSCKYCGKVLPNYAHAADKVAEIQALMQDSDGSGIPNALKGVVGAYAPFVSTPGQAAPYAGPPVVGVPSPYGGAPVPILMNEVRRKMRAVVVIAILLGVAVPLVIAGIVVAAVVSRASAPSAPATHPGRR